MVRVVGRCVATVPMSRIREMIFGRPAPFVDDSTTWADVVEQPGAAQRILDVPSGKSAQHVDDFVVKNLSRLVATCTVAVPDDVCETNEDAATTFPANATALLQRASGANPATAMNVTIALLRALTVKTLHAVAAQNIADVLKHAMNENDDRVVEGISRALADGEVLHCLIRHVAVHTVLGDMILVLMGRQADEHSDEDTLTEDKPPSFASRPASTAGYDDPWIRSGFVEHLAKYARVAISTASATAYFGFLRQLFGCSLSKHVGPVVDELLRAYDGGVDDLSVVVLGALESCATAYDDHPNIVAAASALVELVSMLHRAAFGVTTLAVEYAETVRSNAALCSLMRLLPGVVPYLQYDSLNTELGRSRGTLGPLRLKLVELFVTVFRFARAETDRCLFDARFFPSLFALAEQFPNHDVLLAFVSEVVWDTTLRTVDDRALLKHLVHECALVKRIVRWSQAERGTTLRALACQFVGLDSEVSAQFPNGVDSAWTQFVNSHRDETASWFKSITGEGFEGVGSGPSQPVVHLDEQFVGTERSEVQDDASPSSPIGNFNPYTFGAADDSGGKRRYEVDHDSDDDGDGPQDDDFSFAAASRDGLPGDDEEEDLIDPTGDAVPPPPPMQDEEDEVVTGEDEWIERTIEDVEDAVSPEPKAKHPDRFAVLEQWGSNQVETEHDYTPNSKERGANDSDDAPPPPPPPPQDDDDEDW